MYCTEPVASDGLSSPCTAPTRHIGSTDMEIDCLRLLARVAEVLTHSEVLCVCCGPR